MKRKLLTMTTAVLLSATSLFAQNDNGIIGRARGAASDCLNEYNPSQWDIHSNVNDVVICFVSGTIKEVVFFATPKVSKDMYPLVRFMPIVIATVRFDCNGDIIATDCY